MISNFYRKTRVRIDYKYFPTSRRMMVLPSSIWSDINMFDAYNSIEAGYGEINKNFRIRRFGTFTTYVEFISVFKYFMRI